jgi:hypothetical protein
MSRRKRRNSVARRAYILVHQPPLVRYGLIQQTNTPSRAMQFSAQATGSPVPTHPWKDTLMCVSSYTTSDTKTITKSPLTGNTFTSKYVRTVGAAINAYGIIVKHQSGDPNSASTSNTISSSSTEGTGKSTGSSESAGSGLSSGASIGIGVSVGVVGLALVVGGIYLFLRLRKKKSASAHMDTGTSADVTNYPQVVNSYVTKVPQELDTHYASPQELDSRQRG